jgi:hypothetical protein
MPMLMTARGVVFLEGASSQAPPGTLIGPAMLPPGGAADPDATSGEAGQEPGDDQGDDEEDAGQKPGPPVKGPGQKPAVKPTAKAEALQFPTPSELLQRGMPEAQAAEVSKFREWCGVNRGRKVVRTPGVDRFECQILTKADAKQFAPELLGTRFITFKAGDAGPKGLGLAGTGTRR